MGGSGGRLRVPIRSSTVASIRYSRFSQISAGTPTANSTTTSQAPSVNFTITKTSTTTSEVSPAAKLMTIRRRHADSRVRWWKRAMPNPAIVNAGNTPRA